MLKKSKKGFTLIELLVVIAIIGLLASIVLVWLGGARAKARDTKRVAEVDTLRKALELHYSDQGKYPEATGWIKIEEDADFSQAMKSYLPEIPRDPLWGQEKDPDHPYSYQYSTGNTGGAGYGIHVEMETGEYVSYEVYEGQGGKDIVFGSWACGDSVTFTYKGSSVTYGIVESQGECWIDRNLGASGVATAYNDSQAYGDLFQWGRLGDDLHQNRDSGLTTTLSSTDDPGHSNFIHGMSPPYDWRDPQNDNLWQGVSGTNNPCPDGWRLPTQTEWDTERASWSSQDYNGAFASPLKLTAGGSRYSSDGSLQGLGSWGLYWGSSVDGTYAYRLFFHSTAVFVDGGARANGYSLRCIKD